MHPNQLWETHSVAADLAAIAGVPSGTFVTALVWEASLDVCGYASSYGPPVDVPNKLVRILLPLWWLPRSAFSHIAYKNAYEKHSVGAFAVNFVPDLPDRADFALAALCQDYGFEIAAYDLFTTAMYAQESSFGKIYKHPDTVVYLRQSRTSTDSEMDELLKLKPTVIQGNLPEDFAQAIDTALTKKTETTTYPGRIAAIKTLRTKFRGLLSLKDAKDAIDHYCDKHKHLF